MARTLILCALLTTCPTLVRAQPAERVVHLMVQPMAAPVPALKYQLLPELKEMNPGNPIQGYTKCFAEQQNFWFSKKAVENREKWQKTPLHELPMMELRQFGYLSEGRGPLSRADYAARLTTPDWQILLEAKAEGSRLLLPDIQGLRNLASGLNVRFRAEIAERRYDDAINTAKTLCALGRHLGMHPTVIGNLVGLAIIQIDLNTLEEMVQQPSCPNLYWALTNLPNPLIDGRAGRQGERLMLEADLPLDRTAPMSEEQLRKILARFREVITWETREVPDAAKWFEALLKNEGLIDAARKRLVADGLNEERVKQFPAAQVVLLDLKHEMELRRDARMKWMALPYWQMEAGYLADPLASGRAATTREKFLNALGSDYLKVRKAQARIERGIARLRHVEALRLYAAEHEGKLPAHLSDVTVPLPVDPFTGKAFDYTVKGDTAVLRGPPPKGEEKNAFYNVRYEITIKK
jgi:hypothetical protein